MFQKMGVFSSCPDKSGHSLISYGYVAGVGVGVVNVSLLVTADANHA